MFLADFVVGDVAASTRLVTISTRSLIGCYGAVLPHVQPFMKFVTEFNHSMPNINVELVQKVSSSAIGSILSIV
jgi:hypothetical protein